MDVLRDDWGIELHKYHKIINTDESPEDILPDNVASMNIFPSPNYDSIWEEFCGNTITRRGIIETYLSQCSQRLKNKLRQSYGLDDIMRNETYFDELMFHYDDETYGIVILIASLGDRFIYISDVKLLKHSAVKWFDDFNELRGALTKCEELIISSKYREKFIEEVYPTFGCSAVNQMKYIIYVQSRIFMDQLIERSKNFVHLECDGYYYLNVLRRYMERILKYVIVE